MFTDDLGRQQETPAEMSIEAKLDLILEQQTKMLGAFARDDDGAIDFDGHRRYHEAMIEAAKEQAAFWRELKIDIAKKGLWGLLVILVGLILTGVATKTGMTFR